MGENARGAFAGSAPTEKTGPSASICRGRPDRIGKGQRAGGCHRSRQVQSGRANRESRFPAGNEGARDKGSAAVRWPPAGQSQAPAVPYAAARDRRQSALRRASSPRRHRVVSLQWADDIRRHRRAGVPGLGSLLVQLKEKAMNEDRFNMDIRKFLKVVGVTSQREIENAVRAALAKGKVGENALLKPRVILSIPEIGLEHTVDGEIGLS